MSRLPVVAVVGRPNVGKSTLVNRFLRRRAAVVQEKPGVTRDRREFRAEWTGVPFIVVDTGGWEATGGGLIADVRGQAEAAVAGADLVLVVADATTPVGDDDLAVARIVQTSRVPAVLVANKSDGERTDLEIGHLWALGLGEPQPISALHGRNIGDLLDRVIDLLPDTGDEPEPETMPTLAIIGRPNVGKSTLLNRLAGEERAIVSPDPGTTRDPVDTIVDLDGDRYRIVDTAGIRRAAKVDDATESYSVARARDVLAGADVALLVVDGSQGVTHQEQRLAEAVVEAGAGLILLLNKWDLTDTEQRETTTEDVGDRLAFVSWAPVLRLSALTGARTQRIGAAVHQVIAARRRRIATPELNHKIIEWQEAHPPPVRGGRRAKILYAVQAGTEPPTIVLFARGGELATEYVRYLEKQLRDDYEFLGTPIRLVTRTRPRRPAID